MCILRPPLVELRGPLKEQQPPYFHFHLQTSCLLFSPSLFRGDRLVTRTKEKTHGQGCPLSVLLRTALCPLSLLAGAVV